MCPTSKGAWASPYGIIRSVARTGYLANEQGYDTEHSMRVGGVWDHMLHRRVDRVRQMARHSGDTIFKYSKKCPWPQEHLLAGSAVLQTSCCPADEPPDSVLEEPALEAFVFDGKGHAMHVEIGTGNLGCRRKLVEQRFVFVKTIKGML